MDSRSSGFALIAVGVLWMTGAALNWSVVTRPGKILNRLFGDTVARVSYIGAGDFVFFMGVGLLVGVECF